MNKDELNPNWVSGFVDGEGCFTVSISEDKRCKSGWQIRPRFKIHLHIRDKDLLERILLFFQVGTIWTDEKNKSAEYSVGGIDDLVNKIIPHFYKYPLITNKHSDFLLFDIISRIIYEKEHLSKEGLMNIINLKASLNLGLSTKFKPLFRDDVEIIIKRFKVNVPTNIDYNWFAGFFSGEGCFFIEISKLRTPRLINTVGLRVFVGQHIRDKLLINEFINTLGCGSVKYSTKNFAMYSVNSFNDIYYKIIPMFNKYKIEGEKLLDYKDFCIAAELINKKAHLTLNGLEQIKSIKSRMNKARY